MRFMAKLWGNRRLLYAIAGLCPALVLTQGCERSEPAQPSGAASTAGTQNLPFHPGDQPSGKLPRSASDSQTGANLPFREHSYTLPAGTLLTVRLKASLSSTNVHPGDNFTASVAAPIILDGNTLVERGAEVSGRVESIRSRFDSSNPTEASGYIRLSLNTLNVGSREISLQTSSLFARGIVQASDGVRLPKGRHLTFRLIAPVLLDHPNMMAKGDSSLPNRQ